MMLLVLLVGLCSVINLVRKEIHLYFLFDLPAAAAQRGEVLLSGTVK
jgi:hypothetical protein